MLITKVSAWSGKSHTREIDMTEEEADQLLHSNELIQHQFPHLEADDREFLLTGMTPEEWDEMQKPIKARTYAESGIDWCPSDLK